VAVVPFLVHQRTVASSPVGSPGALATMLDFCARHSIAPITEMLPLSQVNDALDQLRSSKARYRIVLKNDI
jgi:alcohol/geraniol dehydrogenase (NADP+)